MRETPKLLNKKTPKWFQDFYTGDFFHLLVKVETNKRVQIIIAAIVVAILIKVLLG